MVHAIIRNVPLPHVWLRIEYLSPSNLIARYVYCRPIRVRLCQVSMSSRTDLSERLRFGAGSVVHCFRVGARPTLDLLIQFRFRLVHVSRIVILVGEAIASPVLRQVSGATDVP